MTMQFNTVVVSLESPKVTRELREAARLVAPGGRIHALLTTKERDSGAVAGAIDALRTGATPPPGGANVALHARTGDRAEETLRLAVEANADLLILGAYRAESARVVARVMAWAACSVLVLAPNTERTEAEGFVPLFPVCTECTRLRGSDATQWFCELHRDPRRHAFASLTS
ncbi:MAG: universal stress protein [Myxococcales bacterium]|nr:universal stress protein [Myxococcales bacterium]